MGLTALGGMAQSVNATLAELQAEVANDRAAAATAQAKADASMTVANSARTTANAAAPATALAPLADAAAQLPLTQASAAAEHQAIRDLITALTARVVALEGLKVTVGYGTANLPASLAAGASTNVAVTLSKSMGSATYSVGYGLTGGTSLLNLSTASGQVGAARDA